LLFSIIAHHPYQNVLDLSTVIPNKGQNMYNRKDREFERLWFALDNRMFLRRIFHPDLPGGLIAIIIFLMFIAISNVFAVYSAVASNNLQEALGSALSILIYTAPAYGLLKMKRWARLFEIIFSMLLVGLGLVIMFTFNMGMGFLIIITHGPVAVYLLTERCRRVFYPEVKQEG
jgi:hypothetical protein